MADADRTRISLLSAVCEGETFTRVAIGWDRGSITISGVLIDCESAFSRNQFFRTVDPRPIIEAIKTGCPKAVCRATASAIEGQEYKVIDRSFNDIVNNTYRCQMLWRNKAILSVNRSHLLQRNPDAPLAF